MRTAMASCHDGGRLLGQACLSVLPGPEIPEMC
jgi:hypothetical protein